MRTNSELKQIAKDILLDAIACAYYSLENSDYSDIPDEEQDKIIKYIHKYGKAMASRIGEDYYTL